MRAARRAWRCAVIVAAAVLALPASASAADYAFTQAMGSPFETNVDPLDVIVADIDADGFPDAVLGNNFGGTIAIFWGVTGGTFNPTPLELDAPSDHIVVARLDGDADLDIAGAGGSLQPFFKNDGVRSFTAGPAQDVDTGDDYSPANGLVAADFDQDGDNDLALTTFVLSSGGPSGGALRIYKNNPTGTFVFDHNEQSSGDDYGDLVVGRFDADNDPDLAFAFAVPDFDSEPVVRVLTGTTGVDFAPGEDVLADGFVSLATADLDGDGALDLLTQNSIEVNWGAGDGTFDTHDQIASTDGFGFFFGDFNDDGKLDVGQGGDPVRLFTNKGSRTFALGAQFASSDFGYQGAAADLGGDARDDLVLGGFFEMVVLHTGDPPPPDDGGGDDGGGGGTPPPGGGSTPPPGGGTPPMSLPPPGNGPPVVIQIKTSRIAVLPGRRVCGSRRKFQIRLRRPPEGVTVVEARVLVNGKKVAVRRGARLTAPVDLRGLPKGRAVVTIRIKLGDGRVLRGKRVYHPCAKKKRKGKFGRKKKRG